MTRRFVVYGAGAIGGVIGARLFQAGHAVALIARGAHHTAIRDRGLRIQGGDETERLAIPVAESPADLGVGDDDVVILAMKTQDTDDALRTLAAVAPPETPVVCAQNGVENERLALRRFAHVYGVCVRCPAGFHEPGVVLAFSTPVTGILDVGRFPSGVDDTARSVAGAFEASTFVSEPRADIMRWKYRKLILNLGNAAEAIAGPEARFGELGERARAEAEEVLAAAGVDVASVEEDAERRGDLVTIRPAGGERWEGGSSWQSLARETGTIETDYLNGEIVLLGREHGVPTPVNELLQRVAGEMTRTGAPAGSHTESEILALLPGS